MDEATWRRATRELLRALRGHRSQVAFARWLGFRSNVPAAWEGGHRCPDAVELFRVCARVKVDAASFNDVKRGIWGQGTFPVWREDQ